MAQATYRRGEIYTPGSVHENFANDPWGFKGTPPWKTVPHTRRRAASHLSQPCSLSCPGVAEYDTKQLRNLHGPETPGSDPEIFANAPWGPRVLQGAFTEIPQTLPGGSRTFGVPFSPGVPLTPQGAIVKISGSLPGGVFIRVRPM